MLIHYLKMSFLNFQANFLFLYSYAKNWRPSHHQNAHVVSLIQGRIHGASTAHEGDAIPTGPEKTILTGLRAKYDLPIEMAINGPQPIQEEWDEGASSPVSV
jgi:hypothetical protein